MGPSETDTKNVPSVGSLLRPSGGSDPTGSPVDSNDGIRGPRVIVHWHGTDCPECRRWVHERLVGAGDEIRRWEGRIVLVERAGASTPPRSHDAATAWVAVTDEWGEVFHVAAVGPDHDFPDPADVAAWVRFVSIQCPECEGPEGPWRQV